MVMTTTDDGDGIHVPLLVDGGYSSFHFDRVQHHLQPRKQRRTSSHQSNPKLDHIR